MKKLFFLFVVVAVCATSVAAQGRTAAGSWNGSISAPGGELRVIVNLQQKDMLLALDLGRKMGVPVPLGAAANEMLNACRGLGLAHRDFVAVYEVYRRLGGMWQ